MDNDPQPKPPQNRWLSAGVDPTQYDAMWDVRVAAGEDIHDEARLIIRLWPDTTFSLLDAGCGTGRIGIELARNGVSVTGIDLDPAMIARARQKAPQIDWQVGDLASFALDRTFDIVACLGNVFIMLTPGTEAQVIANLVRHVAPGGVLITAFATDRDYFTLAQYDALLATTDLELRHRWSTWQRDPWTPTADYVISVHHRNI